MPVGFPREVLESFQCFFDEGSVDQKLRGVSRDLGLTPLSSLAGHRFEVFVASGPRLPRCEVSEVEFPVLHKISSLYRYRRDVRRFRHDRLQSNNGSLNDRLKSR